MGSGQESPLARTKSVFLLVIIGVSSVPIAFGLVGPAPAAGSELAPVLAQFCAADGISLSGRTVAMLKPTFTVAAYSQAPHQNHSFYDFYRKYRGAGPTTSDLSWLVARNLTNLSFGGGWGSSRGLRAFMKLMANSTVCGLESVFPVSDVQVDKGALLSGNAPRFDVLIVGHAEYVTPAEYRELKSYVSAGGRIVLVGSDCFEVEVAYDRTVGTETYVTGHGFTFNGTVAMPMMYPPRAARYFGYPFRGDNINWIGSTICCTKYGYGFQFPGTNLSKASPAGRILASHFAGRLFNGYQEHEENALLNRSSTSVVGTFVRGVVVRDVPWSGDIATYVHSYGKGSVAVLGLYGEDLVGRLDFGYWLIVMMAGYS